MWTCPQDRMQDEFRIGIHDTSNEFRLKLEGCLGAAESPEVESCWQTAASTIGGRHFTVDVLPGDIAGLGSSRTALTIAGERR